MISGDFRYLACDFDRRDERSQIAGKIAVSRFSLAIKIRHDERLKSPGVPLASGEERMILRFYACTLH